MNVIDMEELAHVIRSTLPASIVDAERVIKEVHLAMHRLQATHSQ